MFHEDEETTTIAKRHCVKVNLLLPQLGRLATFTFKVLIRNHSLSGFRLKCICGVENFNSTELKALLVSQSYGGENKAGHFLIRNSMVA